MPFSARSLDFLFENCLNDSKVWFNEHKEEYKKYIAEPFAELVNSLTPTMLDIDGEFVCDPRKLSRIYRDARYAKGKSIFRDYMWYTFSRAANDRKPLPGYYFSISPDGFDYGCGFYYTAPSTAEEYRKLIAGGDESFSKALNAYKKQSVFTLYGDMYKRDRFPDESEEKRNWLNRKSIGLSCESKDFDFLFSDRLAEKIAADFKSVESVYKFYLLAAENTGK